MANPYLTADLQLYLNTVSGTFTINADVYGLGSQSSSVLTPGSGVLSTNRFYNANAVDPTATLIQTDFATNTAVAGTTFNTNATGDANLLAFLNAQYASGAGANQFIVLRVNPDDVAGTSARGFNFASANNTTESFRPVITFTAIPEPSAMLLGALAGLTLLRRRR